MGNVLVLAEHRQGALRDVSFEMLAVAPKLAEDMGGEAVILLFGSGMDDMAKKIADYGLKVMVVDDPVFENFNAEIYQQALSALLDDLKPKVFMTGHTAQGVDFMPALAVEKKLPLVADVPEAAAMLGLDHAGPAGLTLGYAILARPEALSPRLIAHEARHVHQFETSDGSLERFLREYLRQIIHHGYLDAPWEIDARQFEQVSG